MVVAEGDNHSCLWTFPLFQHAFMYTMRVKKVHYYVIKKKSSNAPYYYAIMGESVGGGVESESCLFTTTIVLEHVLMYFSLFLSLLSRD